VLYGNQLSPEDIANAPGVTNPVIPSGNIRIGGHSYDVDVNMSPIGTRIQSVAIAVVFAMPTSYLLSRTLVPAMASHLLPNFAEANPPSGLGGRFLSGFVHGFERVREAYSRALAAFIAHRGLSLPGVAVMIMGSLPLFWVVGQDFFPSVDTGLMRLHIRAPTGTRIESTQLLVSRIDRDIRRVIPADEFQSISDNIGSAILRARLLPDRQCRRLGRGHHDRACANT
jgi:multidrug efflux pump subunit AcrB